MDISSEMIHSLLPVYLVAVLGVSAMSVGVIEGIAEATASIVKVFSGTLSDWIGRRKPLVLLGYGLGAITKPLFPLASGVGLLIAARFINRVGKGIRGAPRDALIADITPPEIRGSASCPRQSLDTVGAYAGPAIALALMAATHNDYRLVFWVAVVPAFLAVGLIVVGVRETERPAPAGRRPFPIQRAELARLPRAYWLVVAVAGVLTLARFSEAFLLLRASSVGIGATYVPLVLIVMNVVYAASAWPLGRLADRLDRSRLLLGGIGLLVLADLVLALANSPAAVLAGTLLWGLHLGATQGLLSVLISDSVPEDLRGTGFGLFNLVTGVLLLVASVLAGALWTVAGPGWTFAAGAVFASLAALGLVARSCRRPRRRAPG